MIDRMYVDRLLPYFEATRILSTSPLKIQCRCYICGDSENNVKKMRGYFLENRERTSITYLCHNCGATHSLWNFMEIYFPEIHRQYRLDRFRPKEVPQVPILRSTTVLQQTSVEEEVPDEEDIPGESITEYSMVQVDSLPEGNVIGRYLHRRKIDDTRYFYFAPGFRRLANEVSDEPVFSEGSLFYDMPRIVAAIEHNGNIVGLNGRSIRRDDKPRYLIIRKNEQSQMIFNYDMVDIGSDVFICEGVYDCLMITNGVAQMGLSKRDGLDCLPNRVWCIDNQPRNPDVVRTYHDLIDSGERVVLWHRLPTHLKDYKDLNDMAVHGGATKEYLDKYIRENIYSGTRGKLELGRWAHIDHRQRRRVTTNIVDDFIMKNDRRFINER